MDDQNPTPPRNVPDVVAHTAGTTQPPPLILPVGPSPIYPKGAEPLGSNTIEQTPIAGWCGAVEAILRQPRRVIYQLKQPNPGGLIASLLVIAIACSLVYG